MVECAEDSLAHPAEQLREGRIAGQPDAQDERVREEADRDRRTRCGRGSRTARRRECRPVRCGGRAAARRPRAGACTASSPSRGIAGARRPRPRSAARRQDSPLRRSASPDAAASVGSCRIVGAPGELSAPVLELAFELLAAKPVTLPEREVAVLERKLGKLRLAAGAARVVELAEVAAEDADRPAVGRDVVRDDEENVLGRRRARKRVVRSMRSRPRSNGLRSSRSSSRSQLRFAPLRRQRRSDRRRRERAASVRARPGSGSSPSQRKTVRSASCRATTSATACSSASLLELAARFEPRRRRCTSRRLGGELVDEEELLLGERRRVRLHGRVQFVALRIPRPRRRP